MPSLKVVFHFEGGPWDGHSIKKPMSWVRKKYPIGQETGAYELVPDENNFATERRYVWNSNSLRA